jgi:LmbE family N-acetylglucosaminyl deacetylase
MEADMGRVFIYEPHPDDLVLSKGLAGLHYIANGFETNVVSMTSGDAVGSTYFLNGQTPTGTPVACPTPADHPWIHDPEREGYAPVTVDDIGAARLREARAALGVMAMVPPIDDKFGNTITPGPVVHHLGGLHDGFGDPGSGSSTSPVTREGIDAAKAVIFPFVRDYPNSFHITMSPADHHHDHAACGIALREIKQENPTMLGTPMFFISRLYWTVTDGLYAADLREAAGGTPDRPNGSIAWFAPFSNAVYTGYVNHLRNRVIKAYRAWNPAAGAYGIGYHQVRSQFEANFAAGVSVANLFHT